MSPFAPQAPTARVLVIGDARAPHRAAAVALLRRMPGAQVDHVHTLDEAETAIRDARPDLVLLDLAFTDAGGEEPAARLLSIDRDLPIVVLAAEQRVLEAEQRTRDVIEQLAEGVVIIGPDGRHLHLNRAAKAMASEVLAAHPGLTAEQIARLALRPDGTPMGPGELPSEITRTTGRAVNDRLVGLPRADGSIRWTRASTRTLGAGPPFVVVASFTDVTRERAQATRLAEAEQRFRLAFADAPIGIALVSLDGRWLSVNRALCEMTGYTETELLARSVDDTTFPGDLAVDADVRDKLLAGEVRSYELEKRYLRADGSVLWTLLSVSLVRDAGGSPLRFIHQMQDTSQRKHLEHEIRFLAERDPVTGLLNRGRFDEECRLLLANQRRYGGHVALLVIDIDHFKYVNDTLGHPAGDAAIRSVADALHGRMRESDIVARLGGDEFAVLLPNTDRAAAEAVAAELAATIGETQITGDGRELSVTVSIGLAISGDDVEPEPDALITAADTALYDAKDAGRGRYVVHRTGDRSRERAGARRDLAHAVRSALESERFVLHYQPVVRLADRTTAHYEALVRLELDGVQQPVAPGTFLFIADRYGLMPAVDRWVTERVLADIARHRLPGGASVFVNIASASLADGEIIDVIGRLLSEYAVAAERLVFEISETTALSKPDRAQSFAIRLKRLGCGFALDDFGAGLASFHHVRRLPYDYVKIDGEFIRNIADSREDRLLVSALAQVAAGLGKLTIAELVETREAAQRLHLLGVRYAQGIHFGEAVPLGTNRTASAARA